MMENEEFSMNTSYEVSEDTTKTTKEQVCEDNRDTHDNNEANELGQCSTSSNHSQDIDPISKLVLNHDSSCSSSSKASSSLCSSESSSEEMMSDSHLAVLHDALSDDDDNNNHSSITDSNSSSEDYSDSDENEWSSDVRSDPQVLSKALPPQKFFFPRELMNRQIRGDDSRKKRSSRFENGAYSSHSMTQHLGLYHKYEKHRGCVNTLSFNDMGDVLVSGSDDQHVCLWNWCRKREILYFPTGHTSNVFQAKFLPYTNDSQMVTSAADFQVRLSLFDSCGLKTSRLIVRHGYPVRKLAVQRQMPNTFLSAGEDGVVYSIDVREPEPLAHKLLTVTNSRLKPNRSVSLYSIHCNPLKNHEFIVCGIDLDVRLYDQRKISPSYTAPIRLFCPTEWQSGSNEKNPSQIRYVKSATCAMFNYNGTEILASYRHYDICLFDAITGDEVHRYDGHKNCDTIRGVNFYGPRSEYIVSGSDCGYIYFWDKNSEAIVQWLHGDMSTVNCIEPHPEFPVISTSGIESDVKVWMPCVQDPENIDPVEIRSLEHFRRISRRNNVARNRTRLMSMFVLIQP